MRNEDFNKLAEQETKRMLDVMCSKSADYANGDDKLFNFKQAGRMDNISPIEALRGMWLKHRASIQQGLDELLNGKEPRSEKWWIEKLTDDRNYNLLLFGLLKEQYFTPTSSFIPAGTLMQYCDCGGVKPVEDNESEVAGEFIIKKSCSVDTRWFVELKGARYPTPRFLYRDLELHKWVGGGGIKYGYYKSKAEARETIKAYKNKLVPVKLIPRCVGNTNAGWVACDERNQYSTYLWKDLTLNKSTGCVQFEKDTSRSYKWGEAYGYYPTKEIAEAYIKAYEEKNRVV